MRNLKAIRYERWNTSPQNQTRLLTAATWDLANDSVLSCFGPSEKDALLELARIDTKSQTYNLITSWDAQCPNPDLTCDSILDPHFFGDSLTACIVLAGGDIVVVREEPQPGEDRIEIVGSVDSGIVAAKWSPDEELLCIISKEDTVIFMSRSFEGIKDISMSSEDLKASNNVSVGWGKKETQFKGKGAKALRDPTMPEKIDEGVLSPNDDLSANISWRGDGAFLAINTVEGAKRRIIRVYSREGVLDSVSEPVDGLEGALSWRPAGNIIAGIQRLENRVDVVFFERNGLRHGQFSIRLSPEQLRRTDLHINLSWNSDSTVLAVLVGDCTQLWTMGNYHWYLKQEISAGGASLLANIPLTWHPEKPLRLLTASSDSVATSEYILDTARASTAPPYDHGVVAIIDGQNVNVTPFRAANLPPPMALHSILVESIAIDVAFSADSSLIAILHHHGISAFKWDSSTASSSPPEEIGRIILDKEDSPMHRYQQICFSGEDQVFVLQHTGTGSVTNRYSLNVAASTMNGLSNQAAPRSKSPLVSPLGPESVGGLNGHTSMLGDTLNLANAAPSPVSPLMSPLEVSSHINAQQFDSNTQIPYVPSPISPVESGRDAPSIPGLVITSDGPNEDISTMQKTSKSSNKLLSISVLGSFIDDGLMHPVSQDYNGGLHSLVSEQHPISSCGFSTHLPWLEIVSHEDRLVAFGLSANGHLYADSRLLVKNCTSFLVTTAHLIFTTTSHLLKFVHITDVADLDIPPDDPEIDERCRGIERGARLVTAIPTSLSVVLQMPRGNLETIFPRAMVVAGIRKLIDEKNYRKAFVTCRTQRVDLNILYDHAPEQFLSSVSLFIDQVQKVSYIDLFFSSLREEDVTQTMYADTRKVSKNAPATNGVSGLTTGVDHPKSSKVNKICDTILEVLKTRLSTNLQNVITANLCKSPPAIEDGLQIVAQLLELEDEAMADQAAEHICFLADVKKLYESALGLYNLDLALIIAQKSQEDPREYLPFMQNLQEMPEMRRQFCIDDHLGRNTKALNHLFALGSFEELKAYTQKHSLYQPAMSLYRYKPTELAVLTASYAQHLEAKSSMKEAALAYESLQDYTHAAACYLASGPSQWREILSCALSQKAPPSQNALENLAASLFDALTESKDYYSAATIQLEYLDSVENALRSLCKGYFFADAIHLVSLKQKPELLETVVDVGLMEALASSTELLADCKGQLQAQIPRIRELRAKALADPLAFYEGERAGDGDLPDDVSVAASSRLSTNNSLFTRYTGKGGSLGTVGTGISRATSKNRRREERKRARGKKGSVYEEEYLATSVGRLIERVERVRDEIERLVVGLVRRRMLERARAIEANLAEVVEMYRACIPEVFRTDDTVKAETSVEEVYRAVGGDAVLQESMDAAGRPREPPVVPAFKNLSLLGG